MDDETIERLVSMNSQTCLVALDKTIVAIRRSPASYLAATERISAIGERMVKAANVIFQSLPEEDTSSIPTNIGHDEPDSEEIIYLTKRERTT